MPWTDLPTNFKNLVWSGLKKFRQYNNPDDTVSFEDVTDYVDTDNTQMSAAQLNQMTDAINKMMDGELFYTEDEVDDLLDTKQDTLTFDDVPTANSTNPVTSDGIKTALDGKSDLVTGTASGSIITIDCETERPLAGLVAQIEPVQMGTGDPSPSNIRSILGCDACNVVRTGKNLLPNVRDDTFTTAGITFKKNADGSITINGTSTGTAFYNIDYISNFNNADHYITELAGKTVTYSVTDTAIIGLSIFFGYFDREGNFKYVESAISTHSTITLPDDVYKGRVYIQISSGKTLENVTVYPQIELGSEATPYEPYNDTVYSVSFANAGKVYYATLDVTKGELTVPYGVFTANGGENWRKASSYEHGYYLPLSDKKAGLHTVAMCSHAKMTSNIEEYKNTDWCSFTGEANNNIFFHASNEQPDVYAFQAFLSQQYQNGTPVQWMYEFETPAVYHLTSYQIDLIIGKNNISADTGDISVEYLTEPFSGIFEHLNEQSETLSVASGNKVTLYDAIEAPVADIAVNIKPVQDLHGYLYPWSGGCGKNLAPNTGADTLTTNGITFTKQIDGSIKANGTASATAFYRFINTADNFILKAGTYILTGQKDSNQSIQIVGTDINIYATDPEGYTITLAEDTAYSYMCIRITQGQVLNNVVFYPMIRLATDTDMTYAPYSNICPISGFTEAKIMRTRKNLCEVTDVTVSGLSWTVDSEGYITATNQSSDPRPFYYENCQWYVHLKAGTYKIITETKSGTTTSGRVLRVYNEPDQSYLNGLSIPTSGYGVMKFTLTKDQTIGIFTKNYDTVFRFMVMESSEMDYTYEPYGATYSVSFDDAGTIYGASLNVTTGKLTVDFKKVNLADLNWTLNTVVQNTFNTNLSDRLSMTGIYLRGKSNGRIISNVYPLWHSSANSSYPLSMINYNCGFAFGEGPNNKSLYVKDINATTVEEAVALFQSNGAYIVYELANPITYQLSPTEVRTLLGWNNIWTDTGDIINLTYYKEKGVGIAEAVSNASANAKLSDEQTRKMITVTEASMTATKNYAIGDLLIADNQLLRATANIASGSAITIGTSGNAEVVDLATVIAEKVPNNYLNDLISYQTNLKIVQLRDGSRTSESFTIGKSARIIVYILDSTAGRCGCYMIVSNTSGTVAIAPILSATAGYTIDTSTPEKIIITKETTYTFTYLAFVCGGQFTLDN